MKKFEKTDVGWYCGFWNKTNLSIYLHQDRDKLYSNEKLHYHSDFCEYYLVIEGLLIMIVNGKKVTINKSQLFIIDPKEIHKILEFGPDGCIYVVVKEKSYDNSTISIE